MGLHSLKIIKKINKKYVTFNLRRAFQVCREELSAPSPHSTTLVLTLKATCRTQNIVRKA